tara:strand:+ start:57 stop:665 length:609 start_codon:yes stop_codon:yes gene_type:complete
MYNFFYFELMLFCSYIFYRYLAKIFNLKRKSKTSNRHIEDIFDLLKYGIIIYLLIFLHNSSFFNIKYILFYFVSLTIAGFILEIPGVGDTLPNIKKWNKNKFTVMVLFLTMTYLLNKGNFTFDKRNNSILFFFIIFSIITLIISYKQNKFKTLHPHHWQIFLFLSLLIKPKDVKTQILSSIFLSLYSHGIICYSAASIFKHD